MSRGEVWNESVWNSRYERAAASASSVWSLEPNAWVADVVSGYEPGTAIDLACGEGRNALWLAQRGWQVTGVDFSSAGLAVASNRAMSLGVDVEWIEADVTTWVSPSLVDLIVIAYLQLEATQLESVIGACAGFLEPGGRLVLIGHDADNLTRGVGGPKDRAVLHTVAELRRAAKDLEIERCEQYARPVGDESAIDAVLVARRG